MHSAESMSRLFVKLVIRQKTDGSLVPFGWREQPTPRLYQLAKDHITSSRGSDAKD